MNNIMKGDVSREKQGNLGLKEALALRKNPEEEKKNVWEKIKLNNFFFYIQCEIVVF